MLIRGLVRWLDSDLGHSFRASLTARVALAVIVLVALRAFLAPLIAPQNPCDPPAVHRKGRDRADLDARG